MVLVGFVERRTALLLRLLFLLAIAAAFGSAAQALAQPPRYAAFMVDANTREVLYANAADEPRHPASLTKMMTLYLAFDAIEAGKLKLTDPVPISRHAAAQPPSRLGLAVGHSLSVDNAISVIAVKSANDIAVALAEKIGGTEDNFVRMMNAKARELGMRNTHFANANGLTDPTNITTARDLAILSLALIHNHPRFYRYFGERDFMWNHTNLINHNHYMLGHFDGVDGIKTGYTLDSGFTIAASAKRGNRRLVAVVLGEPSLSARSRDVSALLEAGFSVLDRRALGQQATVAAMLPSPHHPALRVEPATEQGSGDHEQRTTARSSSRHHSTRHHSSKKSSHSTKARHHSSSKSAKHGKSSKKRHHR
ncbi:MAG TPA: D-alanyl-D-alanine carboxypeptidase family protein [Sphingomonas sp.]|nr:D-alanyl-D-alanine carboxypeptidase family protein [Sphingomonas sp.]